MRNFLIGVFVGLVLATFAPHAAEFSRNLFDKVRAIVMEFTTEEKTN